MIHHEKIEAALRLLAARREAAVWAAIAAALAAALAPRRDARHVHEEQERDR